MTEIAHAAHLAPGVSQLPVSLYFDERILAAEKRLLFDGGPGYVGHELMVPEIGQYRTLEAHDHATMLVRSESGVQRLSNVCRHRQAIMLQGSGHADTIVCPLHRWTYDMSGALIGAPHFDRQPCAQLRRDTLQAWNGLLFAGARPIAEDLAGMRAAPSFDFSGYKLDRVELHACNYNWKTFIEVYLEDYHVGPFHPGLGNFVTCDDLDWQFGTWYSVQTVGLAALDNPGTETYRLWHEAVKAMQGDLAPPHGAVWLTYYPNIMVEWYPGVLVVSTLIPQAVDRTLNVVEFYYPEEIVEFEREFVEAQQAAYMETAIEDDEIAERMDRGRRALYNQGRSEVGPYQSPFEDGMQHFHEFYRREMGEALNRQE